MEGDRDPPKPDTPLSSPGRQAQETSKLWDIITDPPDETSHPVPCRCWLGPNFRGVSLGLLPWALPTNTEKPAAPTMLASAHKPGTGGALGQRDTAL